MSRFITGVDATGFSVCFSVDDIQIVSEQGYRLKGIKREGTTVVLRDSDETDRYVELRASFDDVLNAMHVNRDVFITRIVENDS